MARLWFIVIALVVFGAASAASAKELWQRTWVEVRSPHFVIVSAISEKATIALVRDLECFRLAVRIVTDIDRFEERIPTKVYVLPRAEKSLGFKGDIKGYFWPEMRANYAAVVPVPEGVLDDVLKHEYVHFLVHNRDDRDYPAWFDEGFAELLSTMTAHGKVIEYGQPMATRLAWLPRSTWMSFERVLDTRHVFGLTRKEAAMFYAQTWLLMHYLMNGRPERKLESDISEFRRLVEAGAAPVAAFETAFGLPVSQLRDILYKYLSNDFRARRLTLREALPEAPTEVVPVSAASIAAQLGLLAWQVGERDEAKRYWDAALVLNPNNVLALVGVGDDHKRAGRFDDAQPYYEKALALEPQNAHAELDYAKYFLDRALAAQDRDQIATYLTESRRHFARSYKLDPLNPETLAMNGSSYLVAGESLDRALESLNEAHAMLPSQAQIKFLLAQAYAMSGEFTKAESLLRSLVAWGQAGTAEAAGKLLQQVSDARANAQAPDRAAAVEEAP